MPIDFRPSPDKTAPARAETGRDYPTTDMEKDMHQTKGIVLASRSPYRAELLRRLLPEFRQIAADLDETPLAKEQADDYVSRLSHAKAAALATDPELQGHVVIGSDQAAVLDGRILGKPGEMEAAVDMLSNCAGREVLFLTGLCLLETATGRRYEHLDRTRVRFRDFDRDTARRYLEREAALDCAGAFRCEGLGINLFEAIDNQDPTALIGLPLIAVARGLRELGVDPLAPQVVPS